MNNNVSNNVSNGAMNKDIVNRVSELLDIRIEEPICEEGNIDILKYAINKYDGFDINIGFYIACKKRNKEIIDYLLKRVDNSDRGIWGACCGGHMDLVKLLMPREENAIKYGFCNACLGGHMDIVELMIHKSDIDQGIEAACEGGHMNVILFLIEKITAECTGLIDSLLIDYWNTGLSGACRGGHMDVVELMMSKGADCWNSGLYGACEGGHIALVEIMLSKGASGLNWGLCIAIEEGYTDIAELLISRGAIRDLANRYVFPHKNKKTRFYHNDMYNDSYTHENVYYEHIEKNKERFMYFSILYWFLMYNGYGGYDGYGNDDDKHINFNSTYNIRHKTVVLKDLIPDVLKLMYF